MTAPTGSTHPYAAHDDGPVPADATAPVIDTPDAAPEPAADPGELDRLRAEVSALNAQLDQRRRRAFSVLALRRIIAAVLIAITAFALVTSVVGWWSANTALNTDRWVATVAPLPRDPQVAAAVADYTTTQVFQAIDVEQRLRTVLPDQAGFVVGPLTGQLREQVRRTVNNVLQSDRFQRIWVEINRRAHQRAVAVIEGTSTLVVAREDRIQLDLLPVINQVLRELSAQLPTLFGKQITLPDLSSGAIPENLRARVQEQLGVTLPPNFAQFTFYDAGKLWAAQQAVEATKRGLVLSAIGTLLLLIIALAVSPGRRRTLLQLGLWLVVAAVAVTASLRAVRTQLLEQVPEGLYRDGVAAAVTSVFSGLRIRGEQIIWIGVVLALVMYLIGPGRIPTWLRRTAASGVRAAGRGLRTGTRAAVAYGPNWIAAHLDLLRIGGLIVAVGFALVLSSWTALLVIALVLAAYEVLVTVIARSAARRRPPAGAPAIAGPS
ncbi:MAG TPA: hypothetical protein VFH03_23645 [Actinoplanes sp.]|nr:hypothetical protein [Actinoplanes sp.]